MAHKVSSGLLFAILAGFFAALASIFAKLAFDSHYLQLCICGKDSKAYFVWPEVPMDLFNCQSVAILLRMLCAFMILISNALMFRSFSKSLLLCSSTAEATITNTATNFGVSGIFGWIMFNEKFSRIWFIGMSLIISGLAVVHSSKEVNDDVGHSVKAD